MMKTYKIISIYFLLYCFFGGVVFLVIFGFEDSLRILKASLLSRELNGTLILFSAFIASIIIIRLMKKRLSTEPYPYFMLGFHIGNLSLILILFLSHIILFISHINDTNWTFSDFLYIFAAPFIEVLIAYLFGFAFIALVPSWLSAYFLFKIIRAHTKSQYSNTSSCK